MADPFDTIDPGQDFEDFAVGLKPVTVKQVDPGTAAASATVENVPATKLIRRRSPYSAGGGEVSGDTVEFVFRANRLNFIPGARDQIVDAAGLVWVIESANLEAFDALCRVQVHLKQG